MDEQINGKVELVIDIPGKPHAQERPFVTKYGNTFDRSKSKAKKKEIALLAMDEMVKKKWKMTLGNVHVTAVFTGANPLSDLDNLLKLALDALSGVVWKDDRQVISLYALKQRGKVGEVPHTILIIMEK